MCSLVPRKAVIDAFGELVEFSAALGFCARKEAVRDVKGKIDKLFAAIERKPKSIAWKLRAKLGTRVKWYNEVDGRREERYYAASKDPHSP